MMILFSLKSVFGGTPSCYSVGQCVSLLTVIRTYLEQKLNEFRKNVRDNETLDLSNENIEWIPISLQKEMLLWI